MSQALKKQRIRIPTFESETIFCCKTQDGVKARAYTRTFLKYFLGNTLKNSNTQIVINPAVYICCNF